MFEERDKRFLGVKDSDLIFVHINRNGVVFKFKSERHSETVIEMSRASFDYLKRKMKTELCRYNRCLLKGRMKKVLGGQK